MVGGIGFISMYVVHIIGEAKEKVYA